jgi:hypothetical protein
MISKKIVATQRATARLVALALVSAIDLFCFSAVADVIELKTDQRIEGAFKQATSRIVSVEVGGQTITFTRDKVRAIYFGAGPGLASLPSLREDALRSLKGLQSAVAGGIGYRDYAPRVIDAKIVVDRYLDQDKADSEIVKTAIRAAMGYYVLASTAWNYSISPPNVSVRTLALDPLVNGCPSAQDTIRDGRKSDVARIVADQGQTDGVSLAFGFSSFWPCASNKITEAENAIRAQ